LKGIVAYIVLNLKRDCNLKGIAAQVRPMRNVNVDLVNYFYSICLHINVNGSVWHSHSSGFYLSTWAKYDSIFVNRVSAPDPQISNESFAKIEN